MYIKYIKIISVATVLFFLNGNTTVAQKLNQTIYENVGLVKSTEIDTLKTMNDSLQNCRNSAVECKKSDHKNKKVSTPQSTKDIYENDMTMLVQNNYCFFQTSKIDKRVCREIKISNQSRLRVRTR